MTCRAPSAATTCSGTPSGAQLSFDPEGRLSGWQSSPTSPTTTVAFLYDNQGNRVEQQATTNGTTTTTLYVGGTEQISTTGPSTTTTTYYYANGSRIGLAVNGTFSFLASDGLGSADVTLSGTTATATASLLYAPYGGVRYSNGTMATDYGFTGQHADNGLNGTANTGLDYYNARYYDPLAGQFTSADKFLPGNGYDILGLSRYAYVECNPENRTDPSGNLAMPGPNLSPEVEQVKRLVLVVLAGGGEGVVFAGTVARGGVALLLGGAARLGGLLLLFGAAFSSSSAEPQSDQPEAYRRNRPQRPDEQRPIKITPDRQMTEVEVDRWEAGLWLKVRNAEQTPGGSGQGRIPPGYGRLAWFMLLLGGVGGLLTVGYGLGDPQETQYPAFPGAPGAPAAPTPTPPDPASQPTARTAKNLL